MMESFCYDQLEGLDVVRDGDVYQLFDGRRRVGFVDGFGGEFSAWVYRFDRRTGNTVATFAGRASNLSGSGRLVAAARPTRSAWA